ncbi:mucin-2-like [Danio aesculapii]|uniref:mucin-2-like n=1 Tax=Danio aesculapii TaxID=1142201 RepID=UPI0024C0B1A0|nr:mucin-2-like [Danio aesculapii]
MEWRTSTVCMLLLALSGIQVDSKKVSPSNHVNSICSMWGNFHFKTFDGDVYQFPGMCEYNLVSDCQSLIRQFSIYVKRTEHSSGPKISRVSITINDIAIELTENQVSVNEAKVTLPVHVSGILVEENTIYTRLYSKMGITVVWNKDDAVMVELDSKYSNRTCGLCGDFNGIPVYNEFIQSGRKVGYTEFGNMHRVPNPTHQCEDPFENMDEQNVVDQCEKYRADCADLLEDEKWSSCIWVLDPEAYIKACTNDLCNRQPEDEDTTALCATLTEYSRQCSHAGGNPPTWRTAKFCTVQCPYNMVHSESGSPCMDTCSHKDTNALCEEHNIDGCFCPPGTVFDDISDTGCIPAEKCQCKHGRVYSSGEVLRKSEEECYCQEGSWVCMSIPGPGLCAVEEGSHFTTFDGKEFTFHGDCNYLLSKDCEESKFIILGQIVPCFTHETDTCLKSIVVLFDNDKKNPLFIKADGTVQHNAEVSLPYMTADFTVFRPSSFHIILQTVFGLQVQVQLVPLMQVYITVDQSFQGKTCGLCGNFNKVLADDLKTPQGVVEGTAVSFANAWKAQSNCPDRSERMDDPCSYSSDSEHFAEHWCSKMKDKESLFAQCHATVNPDSYYKRCKYSSCTCEKSEDCLCTVFSSYARACAAKGVILEGWREIVCDKYIKDCPASQSYSYELQSCQRTCVSLASERQSCNVDFVPVDGCACPDGLYQDENNLCVPMEKCPCYHNGQKIHPGKSLTIRDEHCVCMNGKFHCRSWKTQILGCSSPKVFFNCSTAGPEEYGLECAKTCSHQEVDCFSLDCQSGCQCPFGLLDDGRGHCVQPYNCPCKHDGQYYAPGSVIVKDCNKCICRRGNWLCSQKKCPGICTIYGSGHYKTFDQQRFGFRGDCSYIAAQNKCGNKTGNFHVITENMPCGTTGTTCSKAVGILLGRTWLLLSDGTVTATDIGTGPNIKYNERNVGMYLVIDAAIGLTVLWDRKTTVRIILQPQHMDDVCGLCGNFNGNGKDDFTTQGNLPTTNIMEFVDSWKVLSTCPDAEPDFDPCSQTPNRETWAKIQCSIIKEVTFKDCHSKVDPNPYYENCVKDSCSCDTGGDCECFCTAVAAYAQACNEAGVCVVWRTPEICPVYCDYYNEPGECTWHYSPCHTPCYKTCLNPDGICNNTLPNLEGCYPECPEDKPIFDEKNQICVEECPTPPPPTTTPEPTTTTPIPTTTTKPPTTTPVPTTTTPVPPTTTPVPTTTTPVPTTTTIPPTTTPVPTTTTPVPPTTTPVLTTTTPIPTTTTIPPTTTPVPTTTTTIPPTTTPVPTTTMPIPSTSPCIICEWSDWFNVYNPALGGGNDEETYKNIAASGGEICEQPEDIECRGVAATPGMSFEDYIHETKQVVQCNVSYGLVCKKDEQKFRPYKCFDYEIRVYCCYDCGSTTTEFTTSPTPVPTTTTQPSTTPEPTTTATVPPTTTPEPTTTTPIPTTTTKPPTTTPIPTTTTEPPTTTPELTTTTPVPTTTTEPPTTTPEPTTTTPVPTTTTESPTTTPEPTTTTPVPTTTTEPPTTTPEPTTTTPVPTTTTEPPKPPTTTPIPTTTTEPPTTTPEPTTTTPVPTTTTEPPKPPTTTPIPTTTTEPPTTTPELTTTTPVPTTTTEPPKPPTTTPIPTTTTEPPTTTPEPTTTTPIPTTTTEPPTTTPVLTTTTEPPKPPTTTPIPTTTTEPPTTTPEPTTTTPVPTTTTEPPRPPTTTPIPTTTTEPPTTTPEPTTTPVPTTTTQPPKPPTTTPIPTTTTEPPTTTPEPTTTTPIPTTTTEPPTTTPVPTTTTEPPKPPTTTPIPTTTTEPPTTTPEPTTTTPIPTTTTEPPTTTPVPTTTTEPPKPPTTTPIPTTTTEPPTTTPEPTTTTPIPTTTTEPPTTTPVPTTTTEPPKPPTTTPIPTTTTEPPTTTPEPTTTTPVPTTTTEPPKPPTTTPIPTSTTEPPTTTPEPTTTPVPTSTTGHPKPPTTTPVPTTTPEPPTSTPEPTTTTPIPTTTTEPPTTTPVPTTTTEPPKPPTTTPIPTTTTEPPTTTPEPTTTTPVPTTTTEPPKPPTTTTEPPTTPEPTTTTPVPTTTTEPPKPPTTTPIPTTTTELPTTTQEPTTTTPVPTTTTVSPTTTPVPTTTTEPPKPPTTTPIPTTTTEPPTTTPEPTTSSTLSTPPPGSTHETISPVTKETTPHITQPVVVDTATTESPTSTTLIPTTTTKPTTTESTTSPVPTTTTKFTTTTPGTTTSPTPTPTPHYDCPEWDKNTNETFILCNCTMARCIEDNIIEIIPFECPPLQNITCENGKNPVLVYDEHYCCQYYTCDCFCEGWGDPHYITFDGLFYSYQGNCTYILMEEIRPQYHLTIYIDNVFCDPIEHVSCPRSIIVSYNNQVITLKNHNFFGGADLEALMGDVLLTLPYAHNGVRVVSSSLDLFLSIPQLNVDVSFGATGFSINLPFQHFGNNTQGHCGTCNNNKADDCMIPGGILVDDCSVMADYWAASGVNDEMCTPPTALPTVGGDIKPTPKPCKAHPDCFLLGSELFEACHAHVSPDNFFMGCEYDSCHMSNPTVVCTSLQSYARSCSQLGICVHWRNYTNLCNIECTEDKVFNPCGPAEPPSCDDIPEQRTITVPTEGCFCPEGTLLFNKDSGICVSKCGCMDASGTPREFDEVFEYNCEECVCEKASKSVTCKPKSCPGGNPEVCTEPGFVLVNYTDPSEPCCSKQVCNCDVSMCPPLDKKCNIGYAPILDVPEGKCCPEIKCEPKKVCVHKNTEYEPGTTIPVIDCQECKCTWDVDPKSQFFKIKCGFVQCNEKCDPGYEYIDDFSDCCGKCVQTHCVVSIDGVNHVLQEGASLPTSNPGCDKITCSKVNGQFIAVKYTVQCPPFNISNCQPGTVQVSADGCCHVCVDQIKGCQVQSIRDFIKHNDCQSEKKMDLAFCGGDCNSFSRYANPGLSSCSCCQATRSSNRTVDLACVNGDIINHTYIHVEECSCSRTKCHEVEVSQTLAETSRRKRSVRFP